MKILCVCGSRAFGNRQLVVDFINRLRPDTCVLSGGAPGVDRWAADAARARGLACVVINADWDRYGRQAGMRRNDIMAEICDGCVAFWDGRSRGTQNMIWLVRSHTWTWSRVYGSDGGIITNQNIINGA